MARQINEETSTAVKDLIRQMSGFEEGTDQFNHIQKYIINHLKKSDSMYFLNKKEVNEQIASMGEKFIFHGFFPQAKALEDSYRRYITEHLLKSELTTRLNIVKFLLCMSERPTSNFLDNPGEFVTEVAEEEEEIDWGEYLKEGIERWSPNFDETDRSSCSSVADDTVNEDVEGGASMSRLPTIADECKRDVVVDFKANREELLATIQHTWYNQEKFHMAPFSNWREANIGILWDKFLEDQVMGLVPIEPSSFLSEYKVIREILWQMWTPHTSTVFELVGDRLRPKANVTISSVRSMAFEHFLHEFIPYIEVLDFFREFSKSLEIHTEDCISAVPQTFRSYNGSLQNIIRPIYRKLSALEDTVREQGTSPIFLLKKIHDEVVIDMSRNSNLKCATQLLSRLHYSLQFSTSKLEQDLKVALFLESLYHYFTRINSWLMKNDLSDYSEEFLIVNKNKNAYASTYIYEKEGSDSKIEKWKLNFELRSNVDDFCLENGIIKIIRTTILQIGRNIHLLRLIGNVSPINECKETIHQEFVRKTLEELRRFFEAEPEQERGGECDSDNSNEYLFKYPVVCTDQCQRPTDMDKLENLVDTSDGFLMLAFKDYFVRRPEKEEAEGEPTLFEKLSKITTTMFPTTNFFEKILNGILRDRFTVSGLMVKNILIEKYLLEKQFQFLRHTFMFFDDLIFPFYRGLFEKTAVNQKNWGNEVWLTSHLQDVVTDLYADFYERCRIRVNENWRQCADSLAACGMMALYEGIFQFVLKIKWALYTVNHLAFTDLESKKSNKRQPKAHRTTVMKLKYLKFALTNLLNSIQHYLFSFIFTKCLQRFELDFEKANDLSSIMASHASFLNTVSAMILDVKNCGKDGGAFRHIINSVKMLRVMWNNVEYATPNRLGDYYKVYNECYKAIDPIICPVYIFN
ncbi:hypothetical protein NQ318_015013 [Aromia moschata]|uniref:Gamma-tubulin complex component n=1 Tax=Aromia moschata TaxID=1265417 RepID=A0AAV8YXK1_9CUCU|nr:hypothetical protein NQ318_015013 [Aromia moschata]